MIQAHIIKEIFLGKHFKISEFCFWDLAKNCSRYGDEASSFNEDWDVVTEKIMSCLF